jgi:hypothetical protein
MFDSRLRRGRSEPGRRRRATPGEGVSASNSLSSYKVEPGEGNIGDERRRRREKQ